MTGRIVTLGYNPLYYSRGLENSEGEVLMAPRYRVTLSVEDRAELKALTRAATKTTGQRFLYARALLLCDRRSDSPDGPWPGWPRRWASQPARSSA